MRLRSSDAFSCPDRSRGEQMMKLKAWTLRVNLGIAALLVALASQGQTLRFGLAEDPDILDPTLARTFVGRIVFAALCDKLFDIDEKLNIVPQLATSYEWAPDNKALTIKLRQGVTFHDGEKMDAAAVKYSLERHKTMAGSNRRGELAPVASVDVDGPLGEPALGAARLHRAARRIRRAAAQVGRALQDREDHGDRLSRHHDQCRQE